MQKGDWDYMRKHEIVDLAETWEEEEIFRKRIRRIRDKTETSNERKGKERKSQRRNITSG